MGEVHGWDLNGIDSETKYVLAHLYVEKRTLPNCVKFLRQIKDTCYDKNIELLSKVIAWNAMVLTRYYARK